jgi:hypothetical protein
MSEHSCSADAETNQKYDEKNEERKMYLSLQAYPSIDKPDSEPSEASKTVVLLQHHWQQVLQPTCEVLWKQD